MNASVAIYGEPVEVAGRLDELGIAEGILKEAVISGMQYTFECTRHDPPSIGGILAWGKTTRALRDHLIPKGWTIDNARNYAITVHPSKTFAIAAAGGDSLTGTGNQASERQPSTRTEKGPATRDAIIHNQLSLHDVDPHFPRPDIAPPTQTWILLYYADEDNEEIRMELSLPSGMSEEGYITTWQERIILSPEPFGSPNPATEDDRRDAADDIDISITRRG